MKEGWELAEVSKLPEEEAMNEQSREKQRRLKGEMAEGESLRRRGREGNEEDGEDGSRKASLLLTLFWSKLVGLTEWRLT